MGWFGKAGGVLTLAVVGMAGAAEPTTGPATVRSPEAEAVEKSEFYASRSTIVAAGTVGTREVVGEGKWATAWRTIKVSEVLAGDPEVRSLRLREDRVPGKEGDKVLAVYAGRNFGIQGVAFPDTPAYRKAVMDLRAAKIQPNRLDDPFFDHKAIAEEEEAIVRGVLDKLAKALPEHPYVGAKARASMKITRTESGVYCVYAAGPPLVKAATKPADGPEDDQGVVLWIGAGMDDMDWSNPTNMADPERLGKGLPAALRMTGRQMSLPRLRDEPIEVRAQVWASSAQKVAVVCDVSLREYGEALWKFNEDPPRDLEKAIDYLVARAAQTVTDEAKQPFAPVTDSDGDQVLRQAYAAMGVGQWGKMAHPRKLTAEQVKRLTPALIQLLTDNRCVLNQSPVDGPIISSHQYAYPLLVEISGQKLPAPYSQKLRSLSMKEPVVPSVKPLTPEEWAAKQQAERKAAQERLEAWEKWWKEKEGK